MGPAPVGQTTPKMHFESFTEPAVKTAGLDQIKTVLFNYLRLNSSGADSGNQGGMVAFVLIGIGNGKIS